MSSIPDSDDSGSNSSSHIDQKESKDEQSSGVLVGGSREEPSFALLDGFFEDPEDPGKRERITVPVKTLPTVFGRSHDTNDPHFVGLGKKKALSRKHFSIYYRDQEGGTAEWDDSVSKLKYVQNSNADKSNDKIKTKELPPRGFFVIECLGKNRILVDRERVEQGESMVIKSGSAIRISSYGLYFLLPMDAKSEQHKIEVTGAKTNKKRKSLPSPSLASSASKKLKATGPHSQSELDDKSTDTLLQMFFKAVNAGEWERRHQIIGTTIVCRAVISAAEDPDVQRLSLEGPGVARGDIMDWIEQSDKYGQWVKSMLVSFNINFNSSYLACILAFFSQNTRFVHICSWDQSDENGT
jgi:hypothetical protein